MNKANLLALATLLERKAEQKHFDMSMFFSTVPGEDGASSVTEEALHKCGTVACAIGHAPLIFPAERGETWVDYSMRVLDLSYWGSEWDWCFSAGWRTTDNTPLGAAKRIRWLVEHGLPDNAQEQEDGEEPLCYA